MLIGRSEIQGLPMPTHGQCGCDRIWQDEPGEVPRRRREGGINTRRPVRTQRVLASHPKVHFCDVCTTLESIDSLWDAKMGIFSF